MTDPTPRAEGRTDRERIEAAWDATCGDRDMPLRFKSGRYRKRIEAFALALLAPAGEGFQEGASLEGKHRGDDLSLEGSAASLPAGERERTIEECARIAEKHNNIPAQGRMWSSAASCIAEQIRALALPSAPVCDADGCDGQPRNDVRLEGHVAYRLCDDCFGLVPEDVPASAPEAQGERARKP